MMNLLPYPTFAPSDEAFVDRVGLAEAFRQVCPRDPGTSNPDDGIKEKAVIGGISAGFAGLSGEQGGEAFKVAVGDSVAVHGSQVGFRFWPTLNDLTWTEVPVSLNFSFVLTT